MKLPIEFVNRMNEYFSSDSNVSSEGFWESFDSQAFRGIRLNSIKTDRSDFSKVVERMGLSEKKVPWCEGGFYVEDESMKTGRDPYYLAGVYYSTEPSAMLPAQVLGAKPGDYVLDLCAAPGGKACRLGEDLKGEGLLVANEISEQRVKALLRNIERTGIRNAVILNENPDNIARRLPLFFDKILVDAPCSGEGMFRRDPSATKSWEQYGPESCQVIQKQILNATDLMLKPGGEIVYSTCTFGLGEDEEMVLDFLKDHSDYEVIAHPEIEGVTHQKEGSILPGAMRIWPHISEGDGHFCVHLRKKAIQEADSNDNIPELRKTKKRSDHFTYNQSREAFLSFMKDILADNDYEEYENYVNKFYVLHSDKIHLLPVDERLFDRLVVVKSGDFPGEIKNTNTGRVFVPSNCLALTLNYEGIRKDSILSMPREDMRVERYLKGETIIANEEENKALKTKGFVVVCVDNYPLGFAKKTPDGTFKNLYPKAWRLV
ncbi:MAG TPA: NOL1/NOP2/sun family putative RNA methylase [Saccharofermentans sp.]|nr:NOL1/NOP2/sun family putative RNA methylase [Saccharofermentans sp.]